MASRFRHEDRASVPSGWKVRTVKEGKHRLRLAFPPGRRHEGSGRLVSILHPVGENPCTLRSTNPAELMIMGANPPRRRATGYRVVAVARHHGADLTRDFSSKEEAKRFKATISKRDYFRPVLKPLHANPAELMVMGANPRVEVVHNDNPPPEEIVEEFTGAPVKYLDVYNEPHMPRGRYAQLGPLIALYIKPAAGGQVRRIGAPEHREVDFKDYWNGDAPVIVTDDTARQIYFVAGAQDISPVLDSFGAQLRSDGKYEVGKARRIDYEGRKEHVADPDEDQWKHDHGEEDGVLPTVLFDPQAKRLLYEGGNYRIEGPWIRN
jgi:hypothetical protein